MYEIGLCSSDAMASGTLDKTSCETVWANPTGLEVNPVALMSGSEVMDGTISRPPNGTYDYMYAIIDPEISAKFKITITGSSGTDGVYYTSTSTYRNHPLMTNTEAN
jgi:hypothetical protein